MTTAKKDYNFLCGLDYSDHNDVNNNSNTDINTSNKSTASANAHDSSRLFCGSSIGVRNLVVGLLYFCNQRPGIFVAPYLLLQDIPESKIGFVLFLSGMIALTLQTPAGQIIDELHSKTRVLVLGNLATLLSCLLLSNFAHIAVVTLAVTINVRFTPVTHALTH